MNVASLCAGIGGADLALESHGHRVAWHAEIDPAPSKVLADHWPDVPNHGDLTAIDWATVEPVDIITAGFPCQPFSQAGLRKGTNDERHLWPTIRDAIESLRPRYVFLENVVGHLSLGAAIVVHDLAQLGYVGAWGVLGSADVGGCHRRHRFWLLAADANCARRWEVTQGSPGDEGAHGQPLLDHVAGRAGSSWVSSATARRDGGVDLLPTPRTSDTNGAGAHGDGGLDLRTAVSLLPTPLAQRGRSVDNDGETYGHARPSLHDVAELAWFGRYQPAVDRWATIFGPPPAPTDDKGRLNPPFVEWMLGYPAGWVTGRGLTRTQELRALGNSQQPQTAALALALLAERLQAMTLEEAA